MDSSGYDVAYLSRALAGLPVVLVGLLRSDRVMLRDHYGRWLTGHIPAGQLSTGEPTMVMK